jgi:hypothetical protein
MRKCNIIWHLLLLLLDIICALSIGSFPVLFVEVGMIYLIMRSGTWCWVSVLEFRGWLIVVVTFHIDALFESLPPVETS